MWPSYIFFFLCVPEKIIYQPHRMISSHITYLAPCSFLCRGIPSLESLYKVFGRGLSGDGPYYRVQQGAAEQSEQPAQAAGPARDGGRPPADTIGRHQNGILLICHLCLTEISLMLVYLHSSDRTLSFRLHWSSMDSSTRSAALLIYHCSFLP